MAALPQLLFATSLPAAAIALACGAVAASEFSIPSPAGRSPASSGDADASTPASAAPGVPGAAAPAPLEPEEPAAGEPPPRADPDQLKRDSLRDLLLSLFPAERHFRSVAAEAVAETYRQRGFRPLWDEEAIRHGFGRGLAVELNRHAFPELLALDPEDLLPRIGDSAPVDARDLAHTVAFCDAALLIRLGAVAPERLWPEWNRGPTPGSDDAGLASISRDLVVAATLRPLDVERAMEVMAPKNWVYRRFLEAYPEARQAVLQYSGLPQIPDPSQAGVARPGEFSPYAPAVAAHLADRGYLQMTREQAAALTQMTPELTAAISAFQADYGLETDGIFGPATWRCLNTNAADRYRSLTLNMHRARLLPGDMGERYVIVNIPTAELHAFEGRDSHVLSMRIVHGRAGEESRRTVIFRDVMRELVFGPYWHVPNSLAVQEILPRYEKNLNYLAENRYEIVPATNPNGNETFPPTPENISAVTSGRMQLRQMPGPENSLGHVKFLFPNSHNIYLHDTPAKEHFSRSQRDHSAGCIRVEKPEELAAWILGPQGWSLERVREAMYGGRMSWLGVEDRPNVYIVYFTTFPRPVPGRKVLTPALDVYELDSVDARALGPAIPWTE